MVGDATTDGNELGREEGTELPVGMSLGSIDGMTASVGIWDGELLGTEDNDKEGGTVMTGISEGIEDWVWDGTPEGVTTDTVEGSFDGLLVVAIEGPLLGRVLGASEMSFCDDGAPVDGTPDCAEGSSDAVGIDENVKTGDGAKLLASDGDSDGKKIALASELGEADRKELGLSDVLRLGKTDEIPDAVVGMKDIVGLNETVGTGDGTDLLGADGDSDGKKLTLPPTLGEADGNKLGLSEESTLGRTDGTPD